MTAFDKLSHFTKHLCNGCAVPKEEAGRHAKYRCCHRIFCEKTRAVLPPGKSYNWDDAAEVPYLGPKGCVVAPSDRPFCTAYLCPGHLGKRPLRREYERLCKSAGVPPTTRDTQKIADAVINLMRDVP